MTPSVFTSKMKLRALIGPGIAAANIDFWAMMSAADTAAHSAANDVATNAASVLSHYQSN